MHKINNFLEGGTVQSLKNRLMEAGAARPPMNVPPTPCYSMSMCQRVTDMLLSRAAHCMHCADACMSNE